MNLLDFDQEFSQKTILTIGDVMLDNYIHGKVVRISPEAPVPVFNKTSTESKLGGAANVANNVATLTAKSILLSIVGKDHYGQQIKQLAKEQNIKFHAIEVANRKTTLKDRYIAKGQHLLRVDEEDIGLINQETIDQLTALFLKLIEENEIDTIILQDYNKGLLHPVWVKWLIKTSRERGISTVVDPKFDHLEAYHGCSLIKPNLKEIEVVLGHEVKPSAIHLAEAVQAFQKKVKFENCLVTLGSKGIYSYKTGEIYKGIPAEVTDITGAGDSVISLLSLLYKSPFEEAEKCQLLNAIGYLSCTHLGSYAVNLEEIKEILRS